MNGYSIEGADCLRLSKTHEDGEETHAAAIPHGDGWMVVAIAYTGDMELHGTEPIGWAASREGARKRMEVWADDYERDDPGGSGLLSGLDAFGKSLLGQ